MQSSKYLNIPEFSNKQPILSHRPMLHMYVPNVVVNLSINVKSYSNKLNLCYISRNCII